MSLVIDIDPHGMARVPFHEVVNRLHALKRRFTDAELRLLPYDQIALAALAGAGRSACSLDEVRAERQRRRYRFLHLSPDEFPRSVDYLSKERMFVDVSAELKQRHAPKWADLTVRAQLWFKLNCIYTHVDHPDQRLKEAIELTMRCQERGYLKRSNADRLLSTLDRLLWMYPEAMADDPFRQTIGGMAEEILGYLDDTDKLYSQREIIADYSCTASCYRAMGSSD